MLRGTNRTAAIGLHRNGGSEPFGTVRNRSEPFGLDSDAKLRSAAAGFVSRRCGAGRNGGGTAAKPAGAERRFGSEPNANRSEPPLPRPAPQGRTRHGCGVWVGPVPVRRRPPAGGAGPGLQCGAVRGGRRGSVRHRDSEARNGAARPGSARLGFVRFGSVRHGDNAAGNGRHGSAPFGLDRLGTARCERHGHTLLGPALLGSAPFGSARGQRGSERGSAARHRSACIGSAWFNSARLGSVQGQRGSERGCTASQPGSVRLASARFGTGTTRLGRAARLRTARPGSRRPRLGSELDAPARPHSARLDSARLDYAAGNGAARLDTARSGSNRLGSARLGSARPGPVSGGGGIWGYGVLGAALGEWDGNVGIMGAGGDMG